MNPRQETVLKLIVDEYVRSAEPVGSRFLSQMSELQVSPATIRNDMVALECEGYIAQPHTSAGRVPTEKAYIYYLQNFTSDQSRPTHAKQMYQALEGAEADQDIVKTLAKTLVELSGEMVVAAFDPRSSYFTGVSNLFAKPDFHNLAMIQSLSALVDRFDEVMGEMFDQIHSDPQVMIGSANPFGSDMSSIMVKYTLPSGHTGLLGLVGPMRMDYSKNIHLLERAKEILDEYEEG
ncbi:hypothetical protein KJ611_01825 [Patescibacteria group bacterium]|nr:hypothetical protein [Patescibacteria group bacterium]MBU1705931.1 hypothetical protein [Patescibacteria group bacterium]